QHFKAPISKSDRLKFESQLCLTTLLRANYFTTMSRGFLPISRNDETSVCEAAGATEQDGYHEATWHERRTPKDARGPFDNANIDRFQSSSLRDPNSGYTDMTSSQTRSGIMSQTVLQTVPPFTYLECEQKHMTYISPLPVTEPQGESLNTLVE
ncbi:hypothetical protein STEG23_006755, partial [Scotinomys teguina]